MKVEDVVFKTDHSDDFIKRCVFNHCEDWYIINHGDGYKKQLYNLIHESETLDEFIDNYLDCKDFEFEQAYAVIAKKYRPKKAWYLLRKQLGDRVFKTVSDVGGVKVGNNGFSVILHNGYGDGITRVAVVKKDEWNSEFLEFDTSIEGKDFKIFAYDCDNEVAKTLTGRFGVYYGDGFVVFEKWD